MWRRRIFGTRETAETLCKRAHLAAMLASHRYAIVLTSKQVACTREGVWDLNLPVVYTNTKKSLYNFKRKKKFLFF